VAKDLRPVVLARVGISSPVGELAGFARPDALCALTFVDGRYDPLVNLRQRFGAVRVEDGDPMGLAARFRAYFRGALDALDDLSVDTGGTPFQRRVWAVLRTIPAGRTLSYMEVARRVQAPEAVRAVGAANGANPVAIVVPCHRVIGANGSLTGYGGGLERKRWLLAHENAPVAAARARQARLFE
jgi:methylated-DNA-[protein]-cysteine S-methyltransferase